MDKTIKFGGRDFIIKPYPLKHIIALSGLLMSRGANGLEDNLKFIFYGLNAADPDLTREEFDEMHATQENIADTFKAISLQAGFKAPEGDDPLVSANP